MLSPLTRTPLSGIFFYRGDTIPVSDSLDTVLDYLNTCPRTENLEGWFLHTPLILKSVSMQGIQFHTLKITFRYCHRIYLLLSRHNYMLHIKFIRKGVFYHHSYTIYTLFYRIRKEICYHHHSYAIYTLFYRPLNEVQSNV